MSKYAWILEGFSGEKLSEEETDLLMKEAFEDKTYSVAINGIPLMENKTLQEVEDGYDEILSKDAKLAADFGLIYTNEKGRFLFFPMKPEDIQ